MKNNDLNTYLENLKIENDDKIQKYKNWDIDYKQEYWNAYIFRYWRYGSDTWELVDISKIREDVLEYEPNFDVFLPWIKEWLEEEWFDIENILKLDEKAKKALEVQSNISNNSEQVKNTISTKTETIEGINISNEELAEKIWDLFYDSLSSFLLSLWENINNKEVSVLLKEASENIMKAWEICLPYVSYDFPEMKHTTEIKWLDIDKEELVKKISNLVDSELKDFLEKLSIKINKDWEADKWRWRVKLANELFACADKLKLASEKIK